MDRKLLNRFAVAVSTIALVSCGQDKIAWKPTFAVPLGSGSLTVVDLLGAQPSEIEGDTFTQGGSEIYSFKLVYIDTLDPVGIREFDSTAQIGGSIPSRPITDPNSPDDGFPLPENNNLLRITGLASGGSFRFTRPSVTFDFKNELNMDVQLALTNTFTRNVKTKVESPFTMSDITEIPAGSIGNPSIAQLVIDNSNTGGALSDVFTPTPKFLFYTPVLGTRNGTPSANNGELTIVSTVNLPFKGYGKVFYLDTILLESVNRDNLTENIAALSEEDPIQFAFLRFNFENEMPLNINITGTLVDLNADTLIDQVRFYDVENEEGDYPYNIIAAGTSGTATQVITEMRLYSEHPVTKKNEIEAVLNGGAIILELELESNNFSNEEPVTVEADQRLNVDIGFRTKTSAEIEIESSTQDILDVIQ